MGTTAAGASALLRCKATVCKRLPFAICQIDELIHLNYVAPSAGPLNGVVHSSLESFRSRLPLVATEGFDSRHACSVPSGVVLTVPLIMAT